MESMLLEDHKYGQIPETVSNLTEFFQWSNIKPEKNDYLVGFLYILMLETGFVHKDHLEITRNCDFNYKRLLQLSKTLPENWKKNGSYRIDFVLKSSPKETCTLICMPISDDLLINCTSTKNLAKFSLLVDPLTYFAASQMNLGTYIFQNLDHLARNFKNAVAFPAKVSMVNASGGICGCLQHIPLEIQEKIMLYLDIQSVLCLASTSRQLCHSAMNSSLWIKILDREFRRSNDVKTVQELKIIYHTQYLNKLIYMSRKS